jgi:hypothetical protein
MGLLTKFLGIMAGLSFLAIPLAIFTDTSTGDSAYSLGEAFLAWIIFSVLFMVARRGR